MGRGRDLGSVGTEWDSEGAWGGRESRVGAWGGACRGREAAPGRKGGWGGMELRVVWKGGWGGTLGGLIGVFSGL